MGLAITRTRPISLRMWDVFELVLGIGAGVVGLVGLAYFLFAPRIAIGTAGPPCVESSSGTTTLPTCPAQTVPTTFVHQSLVATNFSPTWIAYFSVLTLVVAAVAVATVLHVRTRAPMWRWTTVILAVLMVAGMSMLDDSLRLESVLTLLQGGYMMLPGVVLAIATGILVLARGGERAS
jgi:hypothetical protein